MNPVRIQLSRKKGWRMPPNTVKVTRPGKFGNPFRVGGYFMVGDPNPNARLRMSWCEALIPDTKFTLIADAAMAVEFFKRLAATGYYRNDIHKLRGMNLAYWCKLGEPCHADVLLELAN
jgi:hypothetical protein